MVTAQLYLIYMERGRQSLSELHVLIVISNFSFGCGSWRIRCTVILNSFPGFGMIELTSISLSDLSGTSWGHSHHLLFHRAVIAELPVRCIVNTLGRVWNGLKPLKRNILSTSDTCSVGSFFHTLQRIDHLVKFIR